MRHRRRSSGFSSFGDGFNRLGNPVVIAPVITSDGGGATAAVDADGTDVTTVVSYGTRPITFSLSGADAALFVIGSSSGILTLIEEHDPEDEFVVIVTATNSAGSDSQTITVTVPSEESQPAWVPEGALIHIDFERAFAAQDAAWVSGTGVVAVDTLLGADENTNNYWGETGYDSEAMTADGYVNGDLYLAAIGDLRTAMIAGATTVIRIKQVLPDNEVTSYTISFVAADGNDAVDISLNMSDRKAEAFSNSGSLFEQLLSVLNLAEGVAINVAALTHTGFRYEFAINGVDSVAATLDATDKPPGNPLVAVVFAVGSDAIQAITFYAPIAFGDGSALEALSDTGVTNTAPVITNSAATVAEGDATTGSTIVTVTTTDAEGNPLVFSLTDDDGGNFDIDASTGVVTSTIDLLTGSSPYNFTVRATDPGTLHDDQVFTITVTA